MQQAGLEGTITVPEQKVRTESSEETSGSKLKQEIRLAWANGKRVSQIAQETGLPVQLVYRHLQNLVKEIVGDIHQPPDLREPGKSQSGTSLEDANIVTISASEFEQLSAKTAEVLEVVAVLYERIARDQEEIKQLRMETRALLADLRAA